MLENYSSLQQVISIILKNNKSIKNELKLLIAIRLLKNSSINKIETHFRNNFLIKILNIKIYNNPEIILLKAIKNLKKIYKNKDKFNKRILIFEKNRLFKIINLNFKKTKSRFYDKEKFPSYLKNFLDSYIAISIMTELKKKNNYLLQIPEFYLMFNNLNKYEKKFNRNGYLVFKNFFKKREIDKLIKSIDKIENIEKKTNRTYFYGKNNKFRRSYNLIGKDLTFSKLIIDKLFIHSLLFKFFNRETYHEKFYLSSMQSNVLFPGAENQVWHIDSNFPVSIPNWLTRLQVAITLDDFTKTNGSTELSPKSHLNPRHPKKEIPRRIKKIICPKGSLIIWHGNLWHRYTKNISKKSRRAILCCFSNSVLRQVSLEDNHFLIIPKSKLSKLSVNTKKILGYNQGLNN
jgi:ectoine hydroxylase-related dioxygenase (phytanoyl-CoA dioxygenase family)